MRATPILLSAALLVGCGARSSLRVPPPREGAGGGASASSATTGAGGGCTAIPAPLMRGRVRDFSSDHPDFEKFLGDDPGIVTSLLGADGEPVYAQPDGTTPTTTGKADFDQWYHDTPGVNLGQALDLPLTTVSNGVAFDSDSFFPIDDELLGNEGNGHNFHFTYETHVKFQYQGGEQYFLAGDDDLFTFVNGHLISDLGGVHGTEGSQVNLDFISELLDLHAGDTYSLDLFFAERHTLGSTLHVELLGFSLCQ